MSVLDVLGRSALIRSGLVVGSAVLAGLALVQTAHSLRGAALAQESQSEPSLDPPPVTVDSEDEAFSPYVDATGGISLPTDFETKFVHIGTVSVEKKSEEPVSELHGTYTRAEDLEAFLRDGHFPDGAVLVKDVRATTNSKLTTGAAAYGADVKVWFVMIKDAKGRFPNNDLWGDGWGWGLFEGKDRTKQVAVNYRTECRSCHVPVKKSDWVYTQCYPALNAAPKKAASTDVPSEGQGERPDLAAMFPQWNDAQRLRGDVAAGREYYLSKTVENTMTCQVCHSFNAKDTMTADGDGLIRAGFPIFASAQRTNIKNSGTNLAALGGNVCVIHFMGGAAPGMTAAELANLDAFLKSGGDKDHATARNIDYGKAAWTIPESFSGGNPERGKDLALQSCITCHNVGDQKAKLVEAGGPLEGHSYGPDDLKELALQIRNPDYKHNSEMPGYTDLRLNNQQLLDLIAWFAAK
ncbi:cytochrome P460 family protein [Thalassoglobus sp.]|uniref:cytochrome P460 family protein n=1 Tax=Thalassoglobus sp. TaxID=2795869 RepID=UPI003AA8F2A7